MTPRSRASSFGHVDKLPSGRWRARYTGPDGRRRSATFTTKTDARAWLATSQADVVRKEWRAPEAGRRTVGAFAADYLNRTDLRESTRGLYASLWRHHLERSVGDRPRCRRDAAASSAVARAGDEDDAANRTGAVLPASAEPAFDRGSRQRHRGQPLPPPLCRDAEAGARLARSHRSGGSGDRARSARALLRARARLRRATAR